MITKIQKNIIVHFLTDFIINRFVSFHFLALKGGNNRSRERPLVVLNIENLNIEHKLLLIKYSTLPTLNSERGK